MRMTIELATRIYNEAMDTEYEAILVGPKGEVTSLDFGCTIPGFTFCGMADELARLSPSVIAAKY